jgi:TolB-like protein/Tfp pilus assembly protein PilF
MADRAESENSGNPADATAGPARSLFISYASHDADTANSICEFLERRGLSCWLAPRDVKPGAQYADAIVGAINDAKTVVLVLSGSAVVSSHVGREVERAASKHKQIISFRIDGTPLSRALEYFLGESQWIDVPTLGMSAAFSKLAEAVGTAPTMPEAAPRIPAKPVGKTRRLAIAAAVVIGVGVAIALGVRFWPSSHRAQEPVVAVVSDKSIAVLPFADMSEKKDQDYFADGMAEEILDLLAKIPDLKVIGRTSSFQFKGKNEDLRTIGKKLNAAYVLEGSVRNSGDQVRITTQLINTRTGMHEWSATYNEHIGDVLKLQDAIAAAVVRELQLTVAADYLTARSISKNVEAYDLYLRGRYAFDRYDQEGLDKAASLFQQALDRDPTFADAEVELAYTYILQVLQGSLTPVAGFQQARRAATNALELDPTSAEGQAVMADIHYIYDWDWAGAKRVLQQIATVAPNNVDVLWSEAALSAALGHWDDALRQIKAALAQDPINPGLLTILSGIQEARGHLSEAEATARRVLDIRPTYGYGHYNIGVILLERGDRDAALIEMQQETIDDGKQQGLAIAYYALGRKTESDAALAGMLKDQADTNALSIAEVYAFRGQSDEAMHWLERAYAQKDPYLYSIKGDPLLRNLEDDRRYKVFLRKMNLPE